VIAERPRRAVVEALAAEGYRERYPEGRQEAPPAANVAPALRLLGSERLVVPYRGRAYELGHVSFEDGLHLVRARAAIEALDGAEEVTPERAAAYLGGMRTIVRLVPRYLLPVEPVRRFFWRLRIFRNPFSRATDAEVGQLLGFFLGSRMRSRVRASTTAGQGNVALIS